MKILLLFVFVLGQVAPQALALASVLVSAQLFEMGASVLFSFLWVHPSSQNAIPKVLVCLGGGSYEGDVNLKIIPCLAE